MDIELSNIRKQFNPVSGDVFNLINHRINQGDKLGVLGPNGAGKSTLLGIVFGMIEPSGGEVVYSLNNSPLNEQVAIKNMSFASPYFRFPDGLNIAELLILISKYRCFENNMDTDAVLDILEIQHKDKSKLLKHYSSGMIQRAKTGIAILLHGTAVLLDEPLTNVDNRHEKWYRELLETFAAHKTVVVAGNDQREYDFTANRLVLTI